MLTFFVKFIDENLDLKQQVNHVTKKIGKGSGDIETNYQTK